jgi:hypothetical protein
MRGKRQALQRVKSVNVLGHDYKITRVSSAKLPINVSAICKLPEREILLDSELKGTMLELVLLHELRHAYHFESGDTQILDHQAQEKDCEQFASFVTSLKKQGVL